jgi:hypothetical protein
MRPRFIASITSSGLQCAAVVATAAIVPLLAPPPAQALVQVSVDGRLWNVSTVTGEFRGAAQPIVGGVDLTNNNAGLFNAGAPWWANESLANKFAFAVRDMLGAPNERILAVRDDGVRISETFGPLFAFTATELQPGAVVLGRAWLPDVPATGTLLPLTPATRAAGFNDRTVVENTYATATEVPGPLPILGAAAAFGYSRKLRKRINRSTNAVATTAGA